VARGSFRTASPACIGDRSVTLKSATMLSRVNQVVDADIVYVRDFTDPDIMTNEQLKHLGLIAHHCYRSIDLAFRCVQILEGRHVVAAGSSQRYLSQSRSVASAAPPR
jgi:hypothetical protein